MTDRKALPIVVDIEDDEHSSRQQPFVKVLLADRGDAEQHIIDIYLVARFPEREHCCSGRGVPRRPASGQARPPALVELSRRWLSQARGILVALPGSHGVRGRRVARAGGRSLLCSTGFRHSIGRGVALARCSEHSCCTGRLTGRLSTLGPFCRVRASIFRY